MRGARTLSCVLTALGLVLGGRGAAGDGEDRRGAAEASEERVAIPFEHRAGDRWRLVVERQEGAGEEEGGRTETEVEAEVLSPYGRDLLVEVRALAVTDAGRRTGLAPRSEANAARLDRLGGGRLALRVDHEGTALDVLNADEVRAALVRARGPVPDAAWPEARRGLLEEWNAVYRACGVPLVPGRAQVTPLLDAQRREVGRDARTLAVETRAGGQASVLTLTARTTFAAADGSGPSWRETFSARFDLRLRRLSGSSVLERRDAGRDVRVRLTFREVPVPPAPLLAAR